MCRLKRTKVAGVLGLPTERGLGQLGEITKVGQDMCKHDLGTPEQKNRRRLYTR